MKIQPEVQGEKPWAKEYFQLVGCARFSPILKANINDKGAIFVEAEHCKAYLFAGSASAAAVAQWFEENHGKAVPWLGLELQERYPYWILSDETDLIGHVHSPFDGKCTVSPIPTPRARKGKGEAPF